MPGALPAVTLTVLLEGGREFCQRFQRGIGADRFVLVDDSIALAPLDGHRRDFGAEFAVVGRGGGFHVTVIGEFVHFLARDVEFAPDEFGGIAHAPIAERAP